MTRRRSRADDLRSPDAVQRVALAKRCAAEPGPLRGSVFVTVPALRSGMKNAAPRPGHDTRLPQIASRIIRMAVAPFLHQRFEFGVVAVGQHDARGEVEIA